MLNNAIQDLYSDQNLKKAQDDIELNFGDILKKYNINFDDLLSKSTKELYELFGFGFVEIKTYLHTNRKKKVTKDYVKQVKNTVDFVLSFQLYSSDLYNQNIERQSELEKNGGVKLTRNENGKITHVDLSGMDDPRNINFILQEVSASKLLKKLGGIRERVQTKKKAGEILKNYFITHLGVDENNIILPQYKINKEKKKEILKQRKKEIQRMRDYLKSQEGLNELEKNGQVKIDRDEKDGIIHVDFGRILSPSYFCIHGVLGGTFFQNLANKDKQVTKIQRMVEVLQKFFIDEFQLEEKDFSSLESDEGVYLTSIEGLNELEKNGQVKIDRDKAGAITKVDFCRMIHPAKFDLNGSRARAFFRHLGKEKKPVCSIPKAIEILKKFFMVEFGLEENNFNLIRKKRVETTNL